MGWCTSGETQDLNQKPRLDSMQPYCFTTARTQAQHPCSRLRSTTPKLQNPPEALQKPRVSTETQIRTLAIRATPRQLGAARVLNGVSPNELVHFRRNTGPKPETPLR